MASESSDRWDRFTTDELLELEGGIDLYHTGILEDLEVEITERLSPEST